MKSLDNHLGYRIKTARELKKMTQEYLSELVGVSSGYIAEIENKKTIPSFRVLTAICQTLNLSVDDLIFQSDSDTAREITRLLTRCNVKQLTVIQAMIEAMLQADL